MLLLIVALINLSIVMNIFKIIIVTIIFITIIDNDNSVLSITS
jgi:hypothetical protein